MVLIFNMLNPSLPGFVLSEYLLTFAHALTG